MDRSSTFIQKVHTNMKGMDEDSLTVLSSVSKRLADRCEPKYIIETDLTNKELAMIEAGEKKRLERPELIMTLEDFEKKLQERDVKRKRSRIKAKIRTQYSIE
jgi:hypothetical protein